jgi:hypothetical protein
MELDLPEDGLTEALRELDGRPKIPGQTNIDHLEPSEWLLALDKQIWQEHVDRDWRREDRRYKTVYRKLTQVEWDRLRETIREEGYLTSMHNCGFGFTCGMLVYEHPEATYPGVPLEPTPLLFVESHHLPQENDKFEDGWQAFSPFTHAEQNAKWLARYKMDPPKSKGHYDY